LSGTGGVANGVYYILGSTNLETWTPVSTNSFDASGDFNVTLPVAANGNEYFQIKSQ
jgi:hypothetical protein